jgi:ABC-type lipoprotein release transport system permease subunit
MSKLINNLFENFIDKIKNDEKIKDRLKNDLINPTIVTAYIRIKPYLYILLYLYSIIVLLLLIIIILLCKKK